MLCPCQEDIWTLPTSYRWVGELGSRAFCSAGQGVPLKVKGRFSGSWAFCVRLERLLRMDESGHGWWDVREGDGGATLASRKVGLPHCPREHSSCFQGRTFLVKPVGSSYLQVGQSRRSLRRSRTNQFVLHFSGLRRADDLGGLAPAPCSWQVGPTG